MEAKSIRTNGRRTGPGVMEDIIEILEYQKAQYKALHYRFARRLSRIGKEECGKRLMIISKPEGTYYAIRCKSGGREITKYLSSDKVPSVRLLKEQRFLTKSLAVLKREITAIEKALNGLTGFDAAAVNRSLPKAYRLTAEHLRDVTGPTAAEQWHTRAAKEKERLDTRYGISHPEHLRHRAKDGTPMRSKSEVIIGNEMIEQNVLFIYEMPVWIGGKLMHPDFVFYSPKKRKVIYWEHVGRLDDPEYMQEFSGRIGAYLREGLTPCVDVIFTFDTTDGDLDSRAIRTIIEEYC